MGLASTALFSGCSASSPGSVPNAAPIDATSAAVTGRTAASTAFATAALDRSGVELGIRRTFSLRPPTRSGGLLSASFKELVVTNLGEPAAEVINSRYALQGVITHGLREADGDWVDDAGNLYIADIGRDAVLEYAPGATQPTFTYSAALRDPINVTTDKHGNVYVADFQRDLVIEFPQGQNTVVRHCAPGGRVEGIAVGASGDVFVSYLPGGALAGSIKEYKPQLEGCQATLLGVSFGTAGGLQVANDGSLVAVDQTKVQVDIIPPPYTAIAGSIPGGESAFHVALDARNDLVFITDDYGGVVLVDTYPAGTPVTTLGSSDGIAGPGGVAAFPYLH
jgi:hypothetical protein